jgi:hypothetical protein
LHTEKANIDYFPAPSKAKLSDMNYECAQPAAVFGFCIWDTSDVNAQQL